MNQSILDWLLEKETPEVRLRTLKESLKHIIKGLLERRVKQTDHHADGQAG